MVVWTTRNGKMSSCLVNNIHFNVMLKLLAIKVSLPGRNSSLDLSPFMIIGATYPWALCTLFIMQFALDVKVQEKSHLIQ